MILDRAKVRELREKMQSVLSALEEETGVKIRVGNASFDEHEARFKVECATISEDGTVIDKDADTYKRQAFLFGLKEEWFGKSFTYGNKTFKIVGLTSKRGTRYPVIGENESGKRFKFPADYIKTVMNTI